MTTLEALVLLAALASCWTMVGVIWIVQLVHYPIFDAIEQGSEAQGWIDFTRRHTSTISWVVGPPMLIEGVTGLWLVVDPPADSSAVVPLVALALMGIAYGVTAFVSAPTHGRLGQAFDSALHRHLLRTNWVRTAAWTTRGVVLTVLALSTITWPPPTRS